MERGPPDAFFYLGSGPTDGRPVSAFAPGFGFCFGFDFETTSDQKDSAMPSKRIRGASVLLFATADQEWRRRDRRKFSLAIEDPGLPAGRAESFPVKGELCLRATLCPQPCGSPLHSALSCLLPDSCAACQIFGAFFRSK